MNENDGGSLARALAEISASADHDTLDKVMAGLLPAYAIKSAAYMGTGIARNESEPFLAVTYSSDWVVHYKSRRYVEIDPVVHQGFRRLLPIDWDDFDSSQDDLKAFFGEAAEFGLGRHGLTIPVHGRGGNRSLFTVTSDFTDRDWLAAKFEYLRDFQMLAVHLHEKVLQLAAQSHTGVKLAPRELECLQWISEGKTAWECAIILGISINTVRCYLETARKKLNAVSNTHAVSIAHESGLFFPRL
ncbi:helix-turn-helix transcriptional regulator [Oricola indica]|uniref:helix-turn-helix transcriptional regulator n=1 Tax=Oricola indica TaxID=2872591 RepID=UPI003CCBFE57